MFFGSPQILNLFSKHKPFIGDLALLLHGIKLVKSQCSVDYGILRNGLRFPVPLRLTGLRLCEVMDFSPVVTLLLYLLNDNFLLD